MEDNKAVTAFWVLIGVMVASGGVFLAVVTRSWKPILYAAGIIAGFLLICLLIATLFGIAFAPLLWLTGKLAARKRPPEGRGHDH